MGRRGGGRETENDLVWRGHPHGSLSDTLRDDEPPALLSLACMLREALKLNEKDSYDSKIEIGMSEFLIAFPYPQSKKSFKFLIHLIGDVINV